MALKNVGKVDEAIQLLQTVVDMKTEVMGGLDPETLKSTGNLVSTPVHLNLHTYLPTYLPTNQPT